MEEQKNTNAGAFKRKALMVTAVATCLAVSAISASAAGEVTPTITVDATEATKSYITMFNVIVGAIMWFSSYLVYKALGSEFMWFLKGVFRSRR